MTTSSGLVRGPPDVVSIVAVQMTAATRLHVCTTRDQPCERHAVGAAEASGLQKSTGRHVEWGIEAAGQHKSIIVDTSPSGADRRSAINVTEETIWQGLSKVVQHCWEHA